MSEPAFLTLDEVLGIHADQIRVYGGASGLRDLALLRSVLAMPETNFDDVYLHPSVFEMAAAHLFHLARNHRFVDGSKWTALMCALVFLGLNRRLLADPGDLYSLVDGVAAGAIDKAEVTVFLRSHRVDAQTFNSLGLIDLSPSCLQCGADGLLGSYQVGIWLVSTQTLLASAWVQPSSPLGTFVDGVYGFRWTSIPTVTIPAGQQFLIGTLPPASPLDAFLVDPSYTDNLGVSGPGNGRFEIGGTLTYPTQNPLAVYAVANASSSYLPEPTTAVSLFFGLTGLATFRRHRRVA